MGLILFSIKYIPSYKTKTKIIPVIALIIGISQVIAILPGISRAGITISTALLLGVSRHESAEFSFMIGMPALFGAIAIDIIGTDIPITYYDLIGFTVSLIIGYLSIYLVFSLLSKSRFWYFAYYCWFISAISLIISKYV